MIEVGHIAPEDDGSDPTSLDFMGRFFGLLAVSEIVDGDIDPKIGQRKSNCATDAAG